MNLNFKEGSTWFITETINCLTSKSDWHITSPTLSPPHHTLKKGIDHQLEGAWSLKKSLCQHFWKFMGIIMEYINTVGVV